MSSLSHKQFQDATSDEVASFFIAESIPMADENEKLEVVITGDGSSAEKMLESVLDLLKDFTTYANRGIKAWAGFTDSIENRSNKSLQAADNIIGRVNAGLTKTEQILTPIVTGINSFGTALNSTAKAGDNLASSTQKVASAAKAAASSNDENADSLKRVELQYRAGRFLLPNERPPVRGNDAVSQSRSHHTPVTFICSENVTAAAKRPKIYQRIVRQFAAPNVVDMRSLLRYFNGAVQTLEAVTV